MISKLPNSYILQGLKVYSEQGSSCCEAQHHSMSTTQDVHVRYFSKLGALAQQNLKYFKVINCTAYTEYYFQRLKTVMSKLVLLEYSEAFLLNEGAISLTISVFYPQPQKGHKILFSKKGKKISLFKRSLTILYQILHHLLAPHIKEQEA